MPQKEFKGDPLLKRLEIAGRKLLMRFFSLWQPKKVYSSIPPEFRIRKILMMRQDKVGDMVITLPFFRALKRSLPEAKIKVLASSLNRSILKHSNEFDLMIYDKRPWKFLLSLWQVFKFHPDVIVDLQYKESATSTLYVAVSFAKWRVRTLQPVKLPYNVCIEVAEETHMREQMKLLFNAVVPISMDNISADFPLSEKEEGFAINFFSNISALKIKRIGMNISAGKPTRMLSNEEYITICRHLREKGYTTILFYAPKYDKVAKEISLAVPGTIVGPVTPDILHVAALMKHVSLMITPDTSVVHIASAFGVPMLALYTANTTNCRQWLPWGVPYRIVQAKDRETMRGIEISEILQKLDELINSVLENK